MDTSDAARFFRERLFSLADPAYRDFHASLMPTVDKDRIIGVRTPDVRRLAREWHGRKEAAAFLDILPHGYYEENNLHGFLLEYEKDFAAALEGMERFLPFIDNWATCDMVDPKVFGRHREALFPHILNWLESPHPYTVRYGLGQLMRRFLDDEYLPRSLALTCRIARTREEYYIRMMCAFLLATACAQYPEEIIQLLRERRLDVWTHNKTIQKAIESRRIEEKTLKPLLRSLRRREEPSPN